MSAPQAVCTQPVRRGDTWHGHNEPCGRKVKRDDLCSMHLAQRERHRERGSDRARAEHAAQGIEEDTGLQVLVRHEHGRWVGIIDLGITPRS